MKKVSIIIPAYNEEKRIGNTLESYCKFFNYLKKKKNLDFKFIFISRLFLICLNQSIYLNNNYLRIIF